MTATPINPTLTIQNMTDGFLQVSMDHHLDDQQSIHFTVLVQKTSGSTLNDFQSAAITRVAELLLGMQEKLRKP